MTSSDPPAHADAGVATSPAEALSAAITREFPSLQRTVQVMVLKSHLTASREAVADIADEVLNEAVEQAIKLVDRWEPERGTRPWIAKIAGYIIMQRRHRLGEERKRFPRQQATESGEVDPSDLLIDPRTLGPDRLFELLDLVEEPDRTLLRRAYVDWESQTDIARRLGITGGALRVRLTRAKRKFALALRAADQGGRS